MIDGLHRATIATHDIDRIVDFAGQPVIQPGSPVLLAEATLETMKTASNGQVRVVAGR
jgi:hypothetical protein